MKLFLFMAIFGGSWVYAFKLDEVAFEAMLFSVFAILGHIAVKKNWKIADYL